MMTYEVNADGRDVALCVGIIRKAKQKARFADAGISDEEELEQIVVSTTVVSTPTEAVSSRGMSTAKQTVFLGSRRRYSNSHKVSKMNFR